MVWSDEPNHFRDFSRLLADARKGCLQSRDQLLTECLNRLPGVPASPSGGNETPRLGQVGEPTHVDGQMLHRARTEFASFRGSSRDDLCAWLKRLTGDRQGSAPVGCEKFDMARHVSRGDDDTIACAPDEALTAEQAEARQAAVDRLLAAVARLPESFQDVLLSYHRDHRSLESIADRLGCSTDAVRSLWARAMKSLVRELAGTTSGALPEDKGKPHADGESAA